MKADNARKNCVAAAPGMGMNTGAALKPTSQEAWPEAAPWRWIVPRKHRQWNAARRARPQRRVGASRSLRGAPRTRWCGHKTLRLSAFRFLLFLSFRSFFFVIAGLDPAIHAEATRDQNFRVATRNLQVNMDHRVKPGGDEKAYCCLTLRIRKRALHVPCVQPYAPQRTQLNLFVDKGGRPASMNLNRDSIPARIRSIRSRRTHM